jgi:hypothetical protein
LEVNVEVDPVLIQLDPINAGGPPGGSAKLLRERANPPPVVLGVIEEYSTSDEALSTAGGAAGMIPPVGVGEDCIGTNPLLLFCDLFFLSGPPPLEGVLPTPPEEL